MSRVFDETISRQSPPSDAARTAAVQDLAPGGFEVDAGGGEIDRRAVLVPAGLGGG